MQERVNVLAVDDNVDWRDLYQEALTEKGYIVQTAGDVASALALLDRQFFHVAIVDIRLDETSDEDFQGLRVLQRIWEMDEGSVALVLSGHTSSDLLGHLRSYEVFDFVNKGVTNPAELARQYKAAEFIQGTLDKGITSLQDVLRRTEQAVGRARREATKRRWLQSPFHFFKGLASRDIQLTLKGAGMVELRPFVGLLCRPLYPWLQSQIPAMVVHDEVGNALAIEGFAWSRLLGQPVVVRFGRRECLEAAQDFLPLGASFPGATVGASLYAHESPHFVGVVHALESVSFDDQFRPPASQRVGKLNLSSH